MGYSERFGEVTLKMKYEDYQWLMLILGASTASFGFNRVTQLTDRLNEGNPNYRPYNIPATSKPTVGRDPAKSRSGDGS